MLVGLGYLLATLRAGRRGDHQRRAFEQSRPPVCVRPRPLIGIAEVPDCGFLIAWEPTLAQDKKCHTCGVGALAGQGGHPHGADANFFTLAAMGFDETNGRLAVFGDHQRVNVFEGRFQNIFSIFRDIAAHPVRRNQRAAQDAHCSARRASVHERHRAASVDRGTCAACLLRFSLSALLQIEF